MWFKRKTKEEKKIEKEVKKIEKVQKLQAELIQMNRYTIKYDTTNKTDI
jgi:hypothetical protein